MIGLDEALARLLQAAQPMPQEACPLDLAAGRVLATDIHAPFALPRFDNAAMDGFALPASAATHPAGSVHRVVGLRMADARGQSDEPTGAWEIATGASMPAGTDRVVPVEGVERLGAHEVRLLRDCAPGDHVRRAGEDYAVGEPVARAGACIDPAVRMALSAFGIESLPVHRRARVAVLCTGDELAERGDGAALQEGAIHGASEALLHDWLRGLGAEVVASVTLGDDVDAIAAQGRAWSKEVDLVVSTGAVSMGPRDVVPAAIEALGATLLFRKVAIRPGKPVLAARMPEGPLWIGLPGNSGASAATYRFLVAPLLRRWHGLAAERPLQAALDHAIAARTPLRRLLQAHVRIESGRLTATLIEAQGSHRLATLVSANAWIVVPEDAGDLARGAIVEAWPRDPAGGWLF